MIEIDKIVKDIFRHIASFRHTQRKNIDKKFALLTMRTNRK